MIRLRFGIENKQNICTLLPTPTSWDAREPRSNYPPHLASEKELKASWRHQCFAICPENWQRWISPGMTQSDLRWETVDSISISSRNSCKGLKPVTTPHVKLSEEIRRVLLIHLGASGSCHDVNQQGCTETTHGLRRHEDRAQVCFG